MAEKTLIIVESPAKSHTISKYVGPDYTIGSSLGHVRDLPATVLGIDLKDNYKPLYIELPEKKKTIQLLKKQAAKATRVYLASDPDREGEAIAFHLRELLKDENPEIQRILFNEITKPALLQAIAHPQDIDMNKVDSQQMRRLLDRLAGYKISPVLQAKIGGPLSAGRVQSIALKLIVEREKEIQAFTPEEFWQIELLAEGSQPPSFIAKLEKENGKALKISHREQCDRILAELTAHPFILSQIKKRLKNRRPPPPLITSTLQQEAFRRFKLPVKKTMQLAQQLYEGLSLKNGETTGLITYMRTDSFRIAQLAQGQSKRVYRRSLWSRFLPGQTPPVSQQG